MLFKITARLSRRTVVVGAGAGLAAAPATPEASLKKGPVMLQDPTQKYAKPPFKHQSQPWPGLARNMDPKPDHGETSYKGSDRLRGRKALITGGDSGMGRAAAIAFAREGASVAINYHPDEEPDARDVADLLKGEGRTILLLPGDIRDEGFCKRLVHEAVDKLGGLDILVSNAAR